MSRRCSISGKGVMTGNNVSHAHNKTRRRFLPNLQVVSMMSEVLNTPVQMRIAMSTLRSIEKRGGLDAYLLSANDGDLAEEGLKIKRRIKKAQAKAEAKSAA